MDSNAMERVKNFFGSSTKRDHVDPYFVFAFAGKESVSETKEQNASPEWNQELRINIQFPPISEKITLQVNNFGQLILLVLLLLLYY